MKARWFVTGMIAGAALICLLAASAGTAGVRPVRADDSDTSTPDPSATETAPVVLPLAIPTETASATESATAILAESATAIPADSATAIITSTSTETVTPLPSETPADTATPAATESPADTATPAATESLTVTVTPTATESPTDSHTPTLPYTLTPTSFYTATPTPTEVLPGNYAPDEVIVKFDPGTSDAVKAQYVDAFGAQVDSQLAALGVMILKVPAGKVSDVVAGLNAAPAVEYAEPNYTAYALDTIPNDPGWASQYGPTNIQAPQAWDISRGSSSVTLAVVDTGVDLSHPDLAAKIVAGYDFVNSDSTAQDDNGHGTHVAGIAAAVTNNGIGIAGVSWGARIMPVKVLAADGRGTYDQVAAGIIWAADNGAKVINLSLGGESPSSALESAVNYAYNHGVVVVAAAGNSGSSTPNYPGAYTNAIAVASTDSSNNRSSFSTYGSFVDIAAPGSSIYSTVPTGSCLLCDASGYTWLSGTSMATPHVAGLVAVLFGMNNPSYDTPAEIRTALESTALDLGSAGWDQYYGYGLAQLRNALLFNPAGVTPTNTLTPTNTPTATPVPQTYYYLRSDSCPTTIMYSWINATGGTNTGLHSDDNFLAVTLPFTFTFNGQPRATAYISTNGFIAFTSDGPAEYVNAAIPNSAAPNEFVAPFWDDLNPFNGGSIFYATIGSAPNRQFVVEWNSVPRYSNEGALTFEAILVESTNEIIFQYNSLNGANADGRSATIGIEFAGGSAGVQHGYNLTGALSNGLALHFAPASGSTPTPAPTCAPTNTPTFTATSTPTNTPTPTPTFTATNTPTNTPTPIPCYSLALISNPSSGGAFSWTPSNCAGGKYAEGTVAQITAITSSSYYRFLNWSGDAGGTANPVSVTMNADKTVTANFEQATFADVPFDHSLYRYIQALYNGGFTAGCNTNPLMYCPDQILNRAQSAVFVLRGQYGVAYVAPGTQGTFGDDWAQGTWAEKWAEGMWASSLTAGCNSSPLLYCPWQNHTRAEASVFYLRIKYGAAYSPPAGMGTVFGDVTDPTIWYAKWVEQAYTNGLLPICGTDANGKPLFCPNDLLSRGWAAYMMVQAKNLTLP